MNKMYKDSVIWSGKWHGKEAVKDYFHKISLIRKNGLVCNIPIPTAFVFNMRKGDGFTFLAEKITDILYNCSLFKFYSKEQLVEYTFVQDVNNMELLKEKVDQATVFTNDFYGVQAWDMDIPMWYMDEWFLKEIGQYLRKNEGRVCFLIRMYSDNKKDIDSLLAAIGKNVNFIFMDIPMLKLEEKMEIVLEWVKEDGFEIRGEAKPALEEMIERLCSVNSYAGLKTIRRTLEALELFTAITWNRNVITKKVIVEYMRQCLEVNLKKETGCVKKMGF